MPDTWLEAVADLPEISKVGLAFLGDRINERGFVSIQDALDFLAMETDRARRSHQAKVMRPPLTKGASKVLARVYGYTPATS